jgi:hypothetical protein
MNSRDVIRHPGPETQLRMVSAMGEVSQHRVCMNAGQILLSAIAQLMDNADCDSGMIVLDGVDIGPFDYVMPSYSNDNQHAAWYSETHSCKAARLNNATAIVGRRDGAWWMHCHALWDAENGVGMGHLLPDKVTLASDATVTLYAFNGGRFDVALDPETAFPIFHVSGEERSHGNALIAKINPHIDVYTAIEKLIGEAGFAHARIFGIGSLVGARFDEGRPMDCPISEVLVSPGASWDGSLKLPVHCVDTDNKLFYGNILKGDGPVLITFELMIVGTID